MSLPATIGRYEILGLLATGGMAEVLLAKLVGPAGFERAVVLKRVLPHLARQAAFRTMFLDEARVVAALRHPNIAQVHELGEENDELYLVMEYIEGETLSTLMRRLGTRKEKLPAHLAAHVVAEACAALHAAHELTDERGEPRNLVHRDVSPQNVMLTYDGAVKVLDFGIAKAADRDTHTQSGVLKGKFAYMSPEQCFDLELDRRSDIFSLGTVLWEMSTGRRLFARKSEAAVVRAVCDEPLPSPGQLVEGYPERLEAVIERALARDRSARYATAAEMRRELVGVVRSLDPEGIPQEELAGLMPKLFAERIEDKREMLRRVSSGSKLTHIPAAEASDPTAPPCPAAREAETIAAPQTGRSAPGAPDHAAHVEAAGGVAAGGVAAGGEAAGGGEIDIGDIEVEVPAPSSSARRPSKVLLAATAVAALAGAAGVVWAFGTDAEVEEPEVASAPAVAEVDLPDELEAPRSSTESGSDEPEPSPDGDRDERGAAGEQAADPASDPTIRVRITTTPPEATVRVGDRELGETPLSTQLDRGTEPVELTIERRGYEPLVERVVPDADQRLRLTLRRSRAPRRARRRQPPTKQAGGESEPQRPGYFRFD